MADPQNVTFVSFLETIEDGHFHGEVTERLRLLVRDMATLERNAGGKPKAVLTLKIALKLDGGVFEVVGEASVTQPKPIRSRSIFYATKDNLLTPNNPRQLGLPLGETRDVSTGDDDRSIRAIH
jgi:hypothetical protein